MLQVSIKLLVILCERIIVVCQIILMMCIILLKCFIVICHFIIKLSLVFCKSFFILTNTFIKFSLAPIIVIEYFSILISQINRVKPFSIISLIQSISIIRGGIIIVVCIGNSLSMFTKLKICRCKSIGFAISKLSICLVIHTISVLICSIISRYISVEFLVIFSTQHTILTIHLFSF